MKALFIGGTGTISTEITKLALSRGWDLTLLNRGSRNDEIPVGARTVKGDINDEAAVAALIVREQYDVVADFIVFTPEQLARDVRLFAGKTQQYIFISSASAYQKPPRDFVITESTPLHNPYWQYSRDKIACEEALTRAYRQEGFPMTIVRPSHTYYNRNCIVPIHGKNGSWQVLQRMMAGKPVLVPGDGSSLWTITHARDFAVAFLGLMGNPRAIGEAFHITSDEALTWDRIMGSVGDALGVTPNLYHVATDFLVACDPSLSGPMTGDKSNCVVFDNRKIKRLVPEFVCATRFDQGVRETIEYMLANPAAQMPDPAFDAWCDKVIAAHEAGKRAFQG